MGLDVKSVENLTCYAKVTKGSYIVLPRLGYNADMASCHYVFVKSRSQCVYMLCKVKFIQILGWLFNK